MRLFFTPVPQPPVQRRSERKRDQGRDILKCVNPHFEGVATADCPMYRNDQKVCFAKGMMNIFTNDMPKRVEPAVRQGIIGLTNRTYYFEYRNGSRLIPPALQQAIRDLFRTNGWTEEVRFDGYVEDYDW